MKILKWIYLNRKPITGMIALILFFLEEIFDISTKLGLGEEWYYMVTALLFLIISFTINGKGIQNISIEDYI